ncbi:filamentation induced by camp protein fic [Sesbania bispinosa]|nr:filamentation induced by camp protein fic [Sesbania bispinosa]
MHRGKLCALAVRPKPHLPQPSAPLFTSFPPLVVAIVTCIFSSRWLKIVLSLNSPKTKEWILLELNVCPPLPFPSLRSLPYCHIYRFITSLCWSGKLQSAYVTRIAGEEIPAPLVVAGSYIQHVLTEGKAIASKNK